MLPHKRKTAISDVIDKINEMTPEYHFTPMMMQFAFHVRENMKKREIENEYARMFEAVKAGINYTESREDADRLVKSIESTPVSVKVYYVNDEEYEPRTCVNGDKDNKKYFIQLPITYKNKLLETKRIPANELYAIRDVRKEIALQLGFLFLYYNEIKEGVRGTLDLTDYAVKKAEAQLFADKIIELERAQYPKIYKELVM